MNTCEGEVGGPESPNGAELMRTLTEAFTPGAPSLPEGLRTLVVSPDRSVEPGTTVRATFAFSNFGGAAATGLRVRFNLPDGLRYAPGSARVDDRALDDVGGETSLLSPNGADLGEVPPGVERRIALAYVVAPTIENGAPIELQAALVASEIDVIGSNVVRLAAQSAPVLQNPETVALLEAMRVAEPGEEIRVAARVHNSGHATAHDVVVVLPVPARTAYVAGSARVDGRELALDERDADPFGFGNAVVVSPALPAGATLVAEYRARIDSPLDDNLRIVLSGAAASSEVAEFDLARAELTVRSASRFDTDATRLVVDAPNDVEPGRRVRVALIAENAGTCAADDVRVRLTLPDGLQYAPGSRAVDGRPVADGESAGAFAFSRIDAGARVEASIDAYVVSPAVDGTPLAILGSLQWPTGSRAFERTVTVRSAPRFLEGRTTLALDGPAQVVPGAEVRATVRVVNDGTAQATGVRIAIDADPALQSLRYVDDAGEGRVQAPGVDLGTLAPGAARTIALVGTVASPIADRAVVRLQARLESERTPPLPLGRLELVVRSRARFSLSGSSLTYPSGEPLRPSRHGDVQVVLANEGTDVAHDVRVQLEVSSAARIESADGATRVGDTLLFGDVPAGARVAATVRVRLARLVARGTTIAFGGRVEAVGLLPFALAPVTISTVAEPRFDEGASIRTQPSETVDAGEALFVRIAFRNTGDGAASRVAVRAPLPARCAYLPGSTAVNDVPLLDVDGGSVLWSQGGLLLEEVGPGVEVGIRYCVIVNTPLPAGTLIDARAELGWDGAGTLALTSPAVRVRSTPAFAVRAHGLPFSVSGIAPRTADILRDVAQTHREQIVLPPPAAPGTAPSPKAAEVIDVPEAAAVVPPPEAAPAFLPSVVRIERDGAAQPAPEPVLHDEPMTALEEPPPESETPTAAIPQVEAPRRVRALRVAFARDGLERALGFLESSDYGGLASHLFAIRTLAPTSFAGVNGNVSLKLAAERDALRAVIDRLFIKMRMPRYALTAKDIEDRASRAALIDLVHALRDAEAAEDPGAGDAAVVLEGPIDVDAVVAQLDALETEPLGTARPWLVLASLLPAGTLVPAGGGDAFAAYRAALVATLTDVAALPSDEFHRVLGNLQNPALDAALRDVRTALRAALDATAVPT